MERRLERGMQVAMRKFISSTIVIIVLATQSIGHAGAGNRFTSSYSCSDAVKTCVSSGTRIVDGFSVTKDCWEWSYYKTAQMVGTCDSGNVVLYPLYFLESRAVDKKVFFTIHFNAIPFFS